MSQETKFSYWPRSKPSDRCHNCHHHLPLLPAAIVVPRSPLGLYGTFCSWNCAKRRLVCLRTRPWFGLLARTAIKTGAKLPIIASARGCPPQSTVKQVVLFDPRIVIQRISYITIPEPTLYNASSILAEEGEPEVFESISQLPLSTCI